MLTEVPPVARVRAAFEANKMRQMRVLKQGAKYIRKYEGSEGGMLDTVSYTTSVTEVEDQGQSLTGESEVMRKFDEAVGEGTLGQDSLTESLDSGKVL